MNRSLLWRAILIVAVVVLAAWSAYPPDKEINLGLDLQGGMHLVLEVQTEDAVHSETDQDMERLRKLLEEEGLTQATTQRIDDTSFQVTNVASSEDGTVARVVERQLGWRAGPAPQWSWRREGDRLLFEMTATNVSTIKDEAVRQALQTIRNRVDAFGVSEPLIARQGLGSPRITVQLPGVDDPERVRNLIKSTAFLEFRLADPASGEVPYPNRDELLQAYGGTLPEGIEIFPQDLRDDQGRTYDQQFWALQPRRVITGRDLRTARPSSNQFGQPVVSFSLKPEGAREFAQVTSDNVGRKLAIVLDGKVQSAPVIESRISDQGQITGNFTNQEVQDLVTVLKSGALPAGIEQLEERTVGASLGQDSIEAGVRAMLIGGVLVVLSMLVVYKLTGFNAVLALLLNIVLVFGALAYFRATLTLPGIAGIVLTIGMAVDANVLVFERIREELRTGRTVKSAVDAGFGKALSSIIDANITTLIAALFLFQFGTGPIRGFAVTLSIGIFASVFTAVFVSRFLFDLQFATRERVDKLSI